MMVGVPGPLKSCQNPYMAAKVPPSLTHSDALPLFSLPLFCNIPGLKARPDSLGRQSECATSRLGYSTWPARPQDNSDASKTAKKRLNKQHPGECTKDENKKVCKLSTEIRNEDLPKLGERRRFKTQSSHWKQTSPPARHGAWLEIALRLPSVQTTCSWICGCTVVCTLVRLGEGERRSNILRNRSSGTRRLPSGGQR